MSAADLTDSSILQARMRQTSAGSQGLYGAPGQGQGGLNSVIYGSNSYSRW